MRTISKDTIEFVKRVAAGENPTRAFAEMHPNASAAVKRSRPTIMLRTKGAQTLLKALRKQDVAAYHEVINASGAEAARVLHEYGLQRDEKRRVLRDIVLGGKGRNKGKAADRIRAIQVDNQMTGDNAPVRVEGEITLNAIFRDLAPTTGLPSPEEETMV